MLFLYTRFVFITVILRATLRDLCISLYNADPVPDQFRGVNKLLVFLHHRGRTSVGLDMILHAVINDPAFVLKRELIDA